MKTFLIILLHHAVWAQMASHSFFSEMKSINPAVINGRPYGQYSAIYGKDTIDKRQVIDEVNDEIGTTEIEITSKSFFRGGKGGGLLTSEFSYLSNDGVRLERDTSPDTDDVTIENKVNFSHGELSLGITNYFGVSIAKQNYEFKSKFAFTFDSIDFEEDKKIKIATTVFKIGGVIPIGNYRFSSYYEQATLKTKTDEYLLASGLDSSSETSTNKALGVAFGYSGTKLHVELGYEKKLSSGSPTRMSLTGEILFWKIALGYTGRIYQDGFEDNNMLVYNQIVYPEDSDKKRIEHIFNFAYGASGGFSVGGSASISKFKADEKSPFLSDDSPEIEADIKMFAYTIKVGFVY